MYGGLARRGAAGEVLRATPEIDAARSRGWLACWLGWLVHMYKTYISVRGARSPYLWRIYATNLTRAPPRPYPAAGREKWAKSGASRALRCSSLQDRYRRLEPCTFAAAPATAAAAAAACMCDGQTFASIEIFIRRRAATTRRRAVTLCAQRRVWVPCRTRRAAGDCRID